MGRRLVVIGIIGVFLLSVSVSFFLFAGADFFRSGGYEGDVFDYGDNTDKVFRLIGVDDLRFVPETKSFLGSGGRFTLVEIGRAETDRELIFGYQIKGRRVFFKVIASPCNLRTKEAWRQPELVVGEVYRLTLIGVQEAPAKAAMIEADYPRCQNIWRDLRPASAEAVGAFFSTGKGFARPGERVADLTRVVERNNLTIRQHSRRMGRKVNAFSKDREYLKSQLGVAPHLNVE